MISRKGGHWSMPFELGAVFTGVPRLDLNVAGNACTSQADAATNGPSCVNMATNSTAQANLASQIAKYQNDLNPVKVYPILSFGVAYNFRILACSPKGSMAGIAAIPNPLAAEERCSMFSALAEGWDHTDPPIPAALPQSSARP